MSFHIRPDQAIKEVTHYAHKLGSGLHTLRDTGEVTVGATPKELVYREHKLRLYRFVPPAERGPVLHVPLLIVYALVNRPYMTDLQEDRSLVRNLLKAGVDVYLIDWGYPDRADRYLTLDDYINGFIDRCVDAVCREHGEKQVDILGICQGGTFSLCYAALHRQKVRNLITMVTPVDFQSPKDMLSHWARRLDVDAAVDAFGNIPGDLLNWTFLMLKPYRLMGQKYVDLVEQLDDVKHVQNFLRMEKWIFDSPDQAGEAFREFMKNFYQENRLMRGGLEIGGREVSLRAVTMPVLNIYATEDHLVPREASMALRHHVGTSDYTEVAFPGGHIGIYVSSKAQRLVPSAIRDWLARRDVAESPPRPRGPSTAPVRESRPSKT